MNQQRFENEKVLRISPRPAPRLTHQGRFSNKAKEYHHYQNTLRLLAGKFRLPAKFKITFYMPMPKSWSKAKARKTHGTPHQSRPDYDNLVKAIQDALHAGKDDSYIWNVHAQKVWHWNGEGCILIESGEEDDT